MANSDFFFLFISDYSINLWSFWPLYLWIKTFGILPQKCHFGQCLGCASQQIWRSQPTQRTISLGSILKKNYYQMLSCENVDIRILYFHKIPYFPKIQLKKFKLHWIEIHKLKYPNYFVFSPWTKYSRTFLFSGLTTTG